MFHFVPVKRFKSLSITGDVNKAIIEPICILCEAPCRNAASAGFVGCPRKIPACDRFVFQCGPSSTRRLYPFTGRRVRGIPRGGGLDRVDVIILTTFKVLDIAYRTSHATMNASATSRSVTGFVGGLVAVGLAINEDDHSSTGNVVGSALGGNNLHR